MGPHPYSTPGFFVRDLAAGMAPGMTKTQRWRLGSPVGFKHAGQNLPLTY